MNTRAIFLLLPLFGGLLWGESPPPAQNEELRDLTAPAAAEKAAADAPKTSESAAAEAPTSPAALPAVPPAPAPEPAPKADAPPRRDHRWSSEPRVTVFGDSHTDPEERAEAVVAIMGDSHAEGPVDQGVVAVMGDSWAENSVGQAVVAIMGDARADADVGQNVVAVMGDVTVNGHVRGDAVCIMGTAHLGPKAKIDGQLVLVGSDLVRAAGSEVRGIVRQAPFFKMGFVGDWLHSTLFKGRLLAFRPSSTVAWIVALFFLGVYVLIGLIARRSLDSCAESLEQQPGKTLLAALISWVAAPALLVLLAPTIVGPILVLLCVLFGTLFGKAAFANFVGRRFTKPLGLSFTAVSVLMGAALMLLLYTIPVLGALAWLCSAALGFGMVVFTLIGSSKRNKAARVATVAVPATSAAAAAAPFVTPQPPPVVPTTPVPPVAPIASEPSTFRATSPMPESSPSAAETTATVPPFASAAAVPPPPPQAAVSTPLSLLPRAAFGIRLGASLLDVILVGIATNFIPYGHGNFVLIYTVYCVVMWVLRGTTVGGAICNLKVVRLDERPLDWGVAIVRALTAFLSLAVAGLGFLWVAIDDQQRQSWHDKVAGTTIVRVPKGTPLL